MTRFVLIVALVLAPAIVRADAVPPPTIKLVSPGKGKGQPLRLAPAKGAKRTMVMTTQSSKARGVKGKLGPADWAPAIRVTAGVEVTDVTTDGDVHFTFAYTKVEVMPDKRVTPEMRKAFEAAVASAVGIKGSGIVTNRGITKSIDFEIPADASPEMKNAVQVARGVATQLAQPLPEEAVSVGAKWQTTSTSTTGELTAETNATYELVARNGTQAKLKVTVSVKGKGSGAGNLTTEMSGRGDTTLDLTSLLPLASSMQMRTETGLDMDGRRLAQVDTNKTTIVVK